MLKSIGSHLVFIATFLCSLLLLLALSMEGVGLISGERGVVAGSTFMSRVQVNILGAGVFFILSGFLLIYLAAYTTFMHRLHKNWRMTLSAVIFSACFGLIFFLIGESTGLHEVLLLAFGVMSVLVSDAISELARSMINVKEYPA